MLITKEKALRGLKNTPGSMLELKSFFKAIIDGKLPSYYLGRFRTFKSYSDVLVFDYSSYVKQQYSKNEHVKAKLNTILAINLDLSNAVDQEIIKDKAFIQQIDSFRTRKWNSSKGRKGEYFTTPEELKLINSMLDAAIDYLKTTYSLE